MGEQPADAGFAFFGIGIRLRATSADSAIVEEAERFWSRYLAPAPETPDLVVTLHRPREWSPLAALQRPGSIRFGEVHWYYEGGRRYLWENGTVFMGKNGALDVYLAPGHSPEPWQFVHFSLNLALLEAFRERGLYYVHAACLRSPNGKTYLIAGDAMQGKSTLTVSLLAAGYSYLSDDAVFLDSRGGSRRILGYAKPFHLGNEVARRFATLLPPQAMRPYGTKVEVNPEQLFPNARLDSAERADVLLFPNLSHRETTEYIPIAPAEALTELFTTSTQVFFDKSLAGQHLAALRGVANDARAYRFAAGLDVFQQPALYAQLLENL